LCTGVGGDWATTSTFSINRICRSRNSGSYRIRWSWSVTLALVALVPMTLVTGMTIALAVTLALVTVVALIPGLAVTFTVTLPLAGIPLVPVITVAYVAVAVVTGIAVVAARNTASELWPAVPLLPLPWLPLLEPPRLPVEVEEPLPDEGP